MFVVAQSFQYSSSKAVNDALLLYSVVLYQRQQRGKRIRDSLAYISYGMLLIPNVFSVPSFFNAQSPRSEESSVK